MALLSLEQMPYTLTASSLHRVSPTSQVFSVFATSEAFHCGSSSGEWGRVPFTNGTNTVWSLLQPSVADLLSWISAPLPPPSQPERIFSVLGVSTTKGWLFPPVP